MNYSHETNPEQVRNTFGTTQRVYSSEIEVSLIDYSGLAGATSANIQYLRDDRMPTSFGHLPFPIVIAFEI